MRVISAGLAAMVFGGVSTGCNTKDLGKWDNITFQEAKKVPFQARGKETQELLTKLGRDPKSLAEAEAAKAKAAAAKPATAKPAVDGKKAADPAADMKKAADKPAPPQ